MDWYSEDARAFSGTTGLSLNFRPFNRAAFQKAGNTTIETTPEAQEQWGAHVNEIVNRTLMARANSWYVSANITGKPKAFLPYLGPEGVGGYRQKCDEVAAQGYEGFTFT